jgi:transposase
MQVTPVGLDIAKHVFRVHGIDQDGQVLIRRQLRRSEMMNRSGIPGGSNC